MPKNNDQPDLDELKQNPEIKEELKKTSSGKREKKEVKKSLWFVAYILFLFIFGLILYLFSREFFGLSESTRIVLQRVTKRFYTDSARFNCRKNYSHLFYKYHSR